MPRAWIDRVAEADAWSFAGGANYFNDSGTVHDSIGKAATSITCTGDMLVGAPNGSNLKAHLTSSAAARQALQSIRHFLRQPNHGSRGWCMDHPRLVYDGRERSGSWHGSHGQLATRCLRHQGRVPGHLKLQPIA